MIRLRYLARAALLSLLLLLSACQSVNIKTGPPTDEEATAQSADRASMIRSEWLNRLRAATVPQQASLLKTFTDSTCAHYIRYGYRIADRWRDESERRGAEIPVQDIRLMVETSTRSELPLLEAYEDILEYGIDGIRRARYFEPEVEDALIRYRDHYVEVYSAVFYPNGSRQDFEVMLRSLQTRSEDLSLRLAEKLRHYE